MKNIVVLYLDYCIEIYATRTNNKGWIFIFQKSTTWRPDLFT